MPYNTSYGGLSYEDMHREDMHREDMHREDMTYEDISSTHPSDHWTLLPLPYVSKPRAIMMQRMRRERHQILILKSCIILGIVTSIYIIINLIIEMHYPPSHLIRALRQLIMPNQ